MSLVPICQFFLNKNNKFLLSPMKNWMQNYVQGAFLKKQQQQSIPRQSNTHHRILSHFLSGTARIIPTRSRPAMFTLVGCKDNSITYGTFHRHCDLSPSSQGRPQTCVLLCGSPYLDVIQMHTKGCCMGQPNKMN